MLLIDEECLGGLEFSDSSVVWFETSNSCLKMSFDLKKKGEFSSVCSIADVRDDVIDIQQNGWLHVLIIFMVHT